MRYLRLKPGLLLGPSRDAVYQTERITLRPGETLFFYTDGVTEATSPADEAYGELRLSSALQRIAESDPAGMIHQVRAEVLRHADGAPQSDDVTMVAITYRGRAAADKRELRS